MIEITLTEMALLLWAFGMTALWMHAREDARVSKRMLRLFIENKDAREQILKAHAEWARENGA